MAELKKGKLSASPVPHKTNVITFDFPEAMRRVIDGRKITRLEWGTNNSYGLLKDGRLMIYVEGKLHQWLVSDGDMLATDWVVLPENAPTVINKIN